VASAVVGTLRILLEANAATIESEFEKATIKIGQFDKFVQNSGRNLSRMVDQFSGQRIVSEAAAMAAAVERVGGVSALTERELRKVSSVVGEATAKLRAMGAEVPPSIARLSTEMGTLGNQSAVAGTKVGGLSSIMSKLGPILPIASVVGLTTSIIRMGTSALESASRIQDLSQKTGIGTEAIQRMQAVAAQTGTTVETFAKSATTLGVNLANGTTKAKGAIDALGLSFQELQNLKPEEQFKRVIAALEEEENVGKRNAMGRALFGKQWDEIAASIAEGYSKIADAATVSSDAQIKALDRAGDRWQKFKTDFSTAVGSMLGEFVLLVEGINKAFSAIKPLQIAEIIGTGFSAGLSPQQILIAIAKGMNEVGQAGKDIELPVKKAAAAIDEVGQSSDRAAPAVRRVIAAKKEAIPVYELAARRMALNQQEAQKLAHTMSAVLAPSIQDTSRQIREAVDAMSLLPSSTAIAERAFEQFKGTITSVGPAAQKSIGVLQQALSGIGPAIVAAIQGGGNIIQSIGAVIGQNLGQKFVESFGTKVTSLFGQTLGGIFNSVIPGLGALLGPLLGKIGGFFKDLFGIDPAVKAARASLQGFQAQLRSSLTDAQKLEAGNEQWKMDVIAVRDAFIKVGKSEEEALKLVEALWDTDNPERAKRAMEEIQRVMDQIARETEQATDAAEDLGDALDNATRDRTVNIDIDPGEWHPPGEDVIAPSGTPTSPVDLSPVSAGAMSGFSSGVSAVTPASTVLSQGAEPSRSVSTTSVLKQMFVLPVTMAGTVDQMVTGIERHLASKGIPGNEFGLREVIEKIAMDQAVRAQRG
jgi:hypothetical protein